jgi:hypothetical protein
MGAAIYILHSKILQLIIWLLGTIPPNDQLGKKRDQEVSLEINRLLCSLFSTKPHESANS